jgi:hypothetical protein
MDTHLVISSMGFSPYAARGLTQTLAPIEQAKTAPTHGIRQAGRHLGRAVPHVSLDHRVHRSADSGDR